MEIRIGDFIKARFWRGEAIWAKVTAINDGAVDAVLANHPAPADIRPDGWSSPLSFGGGVSCGIDEIIDIQPKDTTR